MDKLYHAVASKSHLCVGLDPNISLMPEELYSRCTTIEGAAAVIREYCCGIIDATADVACAVKPQLSYYEAYGEHGVAALRAIVAHAQSKGLYVLIDGKRGDISETAVQYANAYLGTPPLYGGNGTALFHADGITLNPYMGTDAIKPFTDTGKDVFVLVRTSNASAVELQHIAASDGRPLCDHVADAVNAWGAPHVESCGYSRVAAVVGATHADDIKRLRTILPRTLFLIPGYGVQGGTAADVALAADSSGNGFIVNASRGVMYAHKKLGGDYQSAAASMAQHIAKEIKEAL